MLLKPPIGINWLQEWNRCLTKDIVLHRCEKMCTGFQSCEILNCVWCQSLRSLPCPGYSVWNPYGIHGIHQEFHMESMEWMLAETPANFLFHGHHGFQMEWGWNGHGKINSIWIPHGFHWIPYGMLAYPPWIPWNSPYGFHGTNSSPWKVCWNPRESTLFNYHK